MPPDSVAADMYREASWKLQEGGYVHYEISNFAMEGHESKHNQVSLDTWELQGMWATCWDIPCCRIVHVCRVGL